MTASMTAYARKTDEQSWGTLIWELRTVNHRYLDINLRLPEELRAIEMQVREKIAAILNRGKVECSLRYKATFGQSAEVIVNEAYVTAIVEACKVVNQRLHQPSETNPIDILRWPGVVQEQEQDLQPVMQAAMDLLQQALKDLTEHRLREGERLKEIMLQRLHAMVNVVAEERKRRPEIAQLYRGKLLARINELQLEPNMDRFEQELAYLAQRMDVEEELDRLDIHFKEIENIFKRNEPIGRRLDFIMQELNREANTLGSKSVDIRSTQASVELKVLIEQMREQVQNIE